jgi:hypothetical protein
MLTTHCQVLHLVVLVLVLLFISHSSGKVVGVIGVDMLSGRGVCWLVPVVDDLDGQRGAGSPQMCSLDRVSVESNKWMMTMERTATLDLDRMIPVDVGESGVDGGEVCA